jgi:hypothetical protein
VDDEYVQEHGLTEHGTIAREKPTQRQNSPRSSMEVFLEVFFLTRNTPQVCRARYFVNRPAKLTYLRQREGSAVVRLSTLAWDGDPKVRLEPRR